MSATVRIHQIHKEYTNGERSILVKGSTVGECLKYLFRRFPKLEGAILDADGQLFSWIGIFVNNKSAYHDGLLTPIKEGDVIYLIVMVAGG